MGNEVSSSNKSHKNKSKQPEILGITSVNLNSGNYMDFIPPSLSFPPQSQSSQSLSHSSNSRRSSGVSSTTSSSSYASSINNKRKLLLSSNEIIEPPPVLSSSSHSMSASSSVTSSTTKTSLQQHHHYPNHYHHYNSNLPPQSLKTKPLKMRQEDFVNMHVNNYHHQQNHNLNKSMNDSYDDESEDEDYEPPMKRHQKKVSSSNNTSRNRIFNLFKKEKNESKSIINPTTIDSETNTKENHDSSSSSTISDITYAAVGSGAFIKAKDYKVLSSSSSSSYNHHPNKINKVNHNDNKYNDNIEYNDDELEEEKDYHNKNNYCHIYHNHNNDNILPYDRLQHEYKLHDDGRLPTILDVSYQSSTINDNTSMDHQQGFLGDGNLNDSNNNDDDLDDSLINMSKLLIDDDHNHMINDNCREDGGEEEGNDDDDEEEEEEEEDSELLLDNTSNQKNHFDEKSMAHHEHKGCDTPVYSVVTEEAYDLKSKFSSCTKSNYESSNTHHYNVTKISDLDVNDSDYTAKLNSFLDKGHASYEEGVEPVEDISIPMVRLGDLFTDMTLNRSKKYDLLDTPQQEKRFNDTPLREEGLDHRENGNDEANNEYVEKVDVLHATLDQDEEEESLYELLRECHSHPVGESFMKTNDCDIGNLKVDSSYTEEENSTIVKVDSSVLNLTNIQQEQSCSSNVDLNEKRFIASNIVGQNNGETDEDNNEESENDSHFSKAVDPSVREQRKKKHSPFPPSEQARKAPTDPNEANLLPFLQDESYVSKESIEFVRKETQSKPQVNNVLETVSTEDKEVLPLSEIALNVKEHINKYRESQIGTTITVSKQLLEKCSKETSSLTTKWKSYTNVSLGSGSTTSTKAKDAFTHEAMANANFLFANSSRIRVNRPYARKSKVDRQRLSLMSIDEVTAIRAGVPESRHSDPMLLIENAKLELEKQKQRMSIENNILDAKKIQVHVKQEVSYENCLVPMLKINANDVVESKSCNTDIKSKIEEDINKPPLSICKMQMSQKEEPFISQEIEMSPVQRETQTIALDYMSPPSPETCDSLEDILGRLSPSELKKRYSAITPMKSFSPFVRFQRALRLFENDINKKMQTSPKEAQQKKQTPPNNVYHAESRKAAIMAPHTLKIVMEVFQKQKEDNTTSNPITSSSGDVLKKHQNNEDDQRDNSYNTSEHSSPNPCQLSVASAMNDHSPYDETDELSITLTPTHSSYSSDRRSSTSHSEASLSTSPCSTGSEDDIFATLIKKATEESQNGSLSSSFSSSSTPSIGTRKEGEVFNLKSAMKQKRFSDSSPCDSPQKNHNVRWSSIPLSNEKRSSSMNKHFNEDNKTNCIFDENMYDEATPTKDDNEPNRYNDDYENLEYSPMVDLSPAPPVTQSFKAVVNPREIYKNTAETATGDKDKDKNGYGGELGRSRNNAYSPVVDLSPAPVPSSSFRAAVNPREVYNNNYNDLSSRYVESDEKENYSLLSSSIYSPTGETLCSYSPLQMSKRRNDKVPEPTINVMKKCVSPSQLGLSPKQRTPMQARKWRALAAEAEKKKKDSKSSGKKSRKRGSGVGVVMNRTPLGVIRRNY